MKTQKERQENKCFKILKVKDLMQIKGGPSTQKNGDFD